VKGGQDFVGGVRGEKWGPGRWAVGGREKKEKERKNLRKSLAGNWELLKGGNMHK